MRTLYLDCPAGISGDMFLGALIDLGADFNIIERELKKLPIGKFDISASKVIRNSISGTSFHVDFDEPHHHRTFRHIREMIEKSALSPSVKALSVKIFTIIAEAEGKVHGISAEDVHFHEIGAIDSIVDIVGGAVAFDSLKIDRVVSSPVPLGGGFAETLHGRLPVPGPATLEILSGVPTAETEILLEITTPTGAAIVKALAEKFGPFPKMRIEKTGYGAGTKDLKIIPNLLRAVLGEEESGQKENALKPERLIVLETNIDDMSPQVAGYLMEKLLSAGALDVFYTPIQMKKNRPGVLLNVLTNEERKDGLLEIVFTESTSIGLRAYPVERYCLERKMTEVDTPYGVVRVKVSFRDGKAVNIQPEYEDCKRLAEEKRAALKAVIDSAKEAAYRKNG